MAKDMTTFFVQSANWRAWVNMDIKKSQVSYRDYMEAATRAIEVIFKKDTRLGDDCDLISLINEDDEDYFDPMYSGKLEDVPDLGFEFITSCFLDDDENNPKNWYHFLSSNLFENAAQPHNVKLALELESMQPKEVAEFKALQSSFVADVPLNKKVKSKKDKPSDNAT